MAADKLVDSVALDAALTATANSIRTKTGSQSLIQWDSVTGFANAVAAIQTGGHNQSKTHISPSESSQTITPDSGFDGLDSVQIDGISPTYIGSGVALKSAATYYPSSSDQSISASQYLTGAQTIKAVTTSGLSADNIKAGTSVKVGDSTDNDRIASVTGTFTSDGTAAAGDIVSGKSAYVSGAKVNGSLVVSHYYTGSGEPSSSSGVNGDLYFDTTGSSGGGDGGYSEEMEFIPITINFTGTSSYENVVMVNACTVSVRVPNPSAENVETFHPSRGQTIYIPVLSTGNGILNLYQTSYAGMSFVSASSSGAAVVGRAIGPDSLCIECEPNATVTINVYNNT